MADIRQQLHSDAADFDRSVRDYPGGRQDKENDPKTFDGLWSRYEDLGEVGQIWSSMNRTETLINFGLQLLYRNLKFEVTVDRHLQPKLEVIQKNKLFAESVLLDAKLKLFKIGYCEYFRQTCEYENELAAFKSLRNIFAHCQISYAQAESTYYLQDNYKDRVTLIPLPMYRDKVKEVLSKLFPELCASVSELHRAAMRI